MRVDALERDERSLAGKRDVPALPADRVQHDYALGFVGVVGEAEGICRAGVPNALSDLGVEMVVPEQYEVRLQHSEVDLDLVDIRMARAPPA